MRSKSKPFKEVTLAALRSNKQHIQSLLTHAATPSATERKRWDLYYRSHMICYSGLIKEWQGLYGEAALKYYSRALELAPEDGMAQNLNARASYFYHMQAANQLIIQKETLIAQGHLLKAKDLRPQSPDVIYHLGYCQWLQQDEEEAKLLFTQTLDLDPRYWQANWMLSQLYYYKEQDLDKAAATINSMLREDPNLLENISPAQAKPIRDLIKRLRLEKYTIENFKP